jgi:hypothetical protein
MHRYSMIRKNEPVSARAAVPGLGRYDCLPRQLASGRATASSMEMGNRPTKGRNGYAAQDPYPRNRMTNRCAIVSVRTPCVVIAQTEDGNAGIPSCVSNIDEPGRVMQPGIDALPKRLRGINMRNPSWIPLPEAGHIRCGPALSWDCITERNISPS